MKILFLDNQSKQIAQLDVISANIVKITSKNVPNLSGFQVFTESGDLLGDYRDYMTLYK